MRSSSFLEPNPFEAKRRLPALTSQAAPTESSGAFGLTRAEVAARGLGSHVFSALHRPWLWGSSGPRLSARAESELLPLGLGLPPVVEAHTSADGATKFVLGFGVGRVECVHMPRDVADGRVTVCLSSQLGCAMGCKFCATATMGYQGHLSAGQIVAQLLTAVRAKGPRHPSSLTIVFMGMGEPLHNFSEVARAIQILCEPTGLGVSARRVTVSTSGLVPEIERLALLDVRPLLAVSLNATTDEVRSAIMPVNHKYPLARLRQALLAYPLRAKERITLEYVLLAGVNDSLEDAERLLEFGRGFSHHINLIPFNAHPGAAFRAPSPERVDAFFRRLYELGSRLVTIRHSRGRDIGGACGQLITAAR